MRLGGELGFAGAERVLSMLREIAAAAPNAAVITVDVAELARSHPAAVMVLRTEIETLAPRVPTARVSGGRSRFRRAAAA